MPFELSSSPPNIPSEQQGLLSRIETLAGEFGQAALYTGIQQPIDGFTQLVNHVSGRELLPDVQLIDSPPPAAFGSADWFAEAAGTGVGVILPYLATSWATKKLGGMMGASGILERMPMAAQVTGLVEASPLLGRTLTYAAPLAKGALDGMIYGTLFQSSGSDKTFWRDRLVNGTTNALTFAVASVGTDVTMAALKKAGMPLSTAYWRLAAGTLANGVGGAATGFVNAEAGSLLNGQGFASSRDVMRDIVTYSVTNAMLQATARQENAGTALPERISLPKQARFLPRRVRLPFYEQRDYN